MAGLTISSGVRRRPYRIVVNGVEGVGKTTFASKAPKPVYADLELGSSSLNVDRFDGLASFDDLLNCIAELYETKHPYKTFVVDSASIVEQWIQRKVCDDEGVKSVEEIPYGKGFGLAAEYFKTFLQGLDALVDKGLNVIVICHTVVRRVDEPTGDSYDTYDIALNKRIAPMVKQWADTVLFADHDKTTVEKGEGFNKRTVAKSYGERMMWTEHRASHVAKNRYNLPTQLPLDWDAFEAAVTEFFNSNGKKEQAA